MRKFGLHGFYVFNGIVAANLQLLEHVCLVVVNTKQFAVVSVILQISYWNYDIQTFKLGSSRLGVRRFYRYFGETLTGKANGKARTV